MKHFGDAGTVITISSVASTAIHPGMSSYAATKLAINRLDECLQVGKEEASYLSRRVVAKKTIPIRAPESPCFQLDAR